jgi:hypothetical protein
MNRLRSALLVCVAAAACGDSSGPSVPDLRSSYDLTIRFVQTNLTTNVTESAACAGTININSQSSGAFSGTFSIVITPVTPCPNLNGTVSGQVASDHKVVLHMMRPNQPNEVVWMTGCTVLSGNGDEFFGIFGGGRITASLSAGIRCPAPNNTFTDYSFQSHVVAVQM